MHMGNTQQVGEMISKMCTSVLLSPLILLFHFFAYCHCKILLHVNNILVIITIITIIIEIVIHSIIICTRCVLLTMC